MCELHTQVVGCESCATAGSVGEDGYQTAKLGFCGKCAAVPWSTQCGCVKLFAPPWCRCTYCRGLQSAFDVQALPE